MVGGKCMGLEASLQLVTNAVSYNNSVVISCVASTGYVSFCNNFLQLRHFSVSNAQTVMTVLLQFGYNMRTIQHTGSSAIMTRGCRAAASGLGVCLT